MSTSKRLGFIFTALLVGMLTMPVLAQTDNGGGGGQNGGGQNGGGGGGGGGGGQNGGGRGGNFNPAQFQQRMMQRIQQALGASDDEFAAIQPKIQAVMDLQRDANSNPRGMFGMGRGGRGGGGGGPGGGGPGGGGFGGPSTQPASPVQAALADLRTTLDDQNASPDVIKSKLDTLRQARAKARQDLAVAQQDLKSVLTQRQEAVMVLYGYLD
jgi:hypothetical protein